MTDLFSLTPQTVEQIRAELQAQEHAAKAQARLAAAPPPEEFRLTGSNSPADLAIAAGQLELQAEASDDGPILDPKAPALCATEEDRRGLAEWRAEHPFKGHDYQQRKEQA